MREYAEAGNKLIVGEVFGVEDAARAVAKDYPEDGLPDGLELQAGWALANFSVFDNYIQDAVLSHRHDRRRDDQVEAASAWSAAIRSRRSTG